MDFLPNGAVWVLDTVICQFPAPAKILSSPFFDPSLDARAGFVREVQRSFALLRMTAGWVGVLSHVSCETWGTRCNVKVNFQVHCSRQECPLYTDGSLLRHATRPVAPRASRPRLAGWEAGFNWPMLATSSDPLVFPAMMGLPGVVS